MIEPKLLIMKKGAPAGCIGAIDKDLTPGSKCGPAIRNVFLVECCIGGYGSITINDKLFPITPRSAYFLLPGDTVTHRADEVEPREGFYVSFWGMEYASILKRAGISADHPFAPPEAFDEILEHTKAIYEMQGDADLGAEMRRQSHLYAVFGALLRSSDTTDTNARVARAIGYMETNYPNPISVELLADEVGLERSYLSTLFKEHTGTSPHAYLTSIRVKMAAQLMQDDRYSMSEIAEAVGLQAQNFARIFRRELGVTPLEYKRAQNKK